jgi:nucleoside-diphosphate kinase
MAMVWEGPNAVALVRQTMGSTRPAEAAPGTVRHDFALEVGRNLTHASDKVETGEREAALWFKPGELVDWSRETDRWIFEK